MDKPKWHPAWLTPKFSRGYSSPLTIKMNLLELKWKEITLKKTLPPKKRTLFEVLKVMIAKTSETHTCTRNQWVNIHFKKNTTFGAYCNIRMEYWENILAR